MDIMNQQKANILFMHDSKQLHLLALQIVDFCFVLF